MTVYPITSHKFHRTSDIKLSLANAIKTKDYRNFKLFVKIANPEELTQPLGKSGFSVLHLAAKSKDPYFIHAILDIFHDHNIDLTTTPMPLKNGMRKEGNGETIFHMVAKGDGFSSVLERLLQHYPEGALIKDKYGSTPLHKSIRSAKKTALLLNYVKALPINYIGNTPLHTATTAYLKQQDMSWKSNLLPIIFYLYGKKFGGSVFAIENKNGKTPLEIELKKAYIDSNHWDAMKEWIKAVALKANISEHITEKDINEAKQIAEENRPATFKELVAA